MNENESLIPIERIEAKIYVVRGERVMLDSDLASLYGVTTFNFNKAVKRNIKRFPDDFRFQLTKEEYESLKFQIGISNTGRGGRRYLPFVFTEHGAIQAANVLSSERGVDSGLANRARVC